MSVAVPVAPPRGTDSTRREVLALGVPAAAMGLVDMAQHWVNQFWVGRLGTDATAALSGATLGVWAHQGVVLLLSVGLAALVGRYAGGGRDGAARYVAAHGLRWAWPLALAVALVGGALAPAMFAVAGTSGAATRAGVLYLRIFYVGGVAATSLAACDAIWRGRGTTRVSLAVGACILVVNGTLDPLLIFGAGPVRGLGVAGAAIASVAAKAVGATISFRLLARRGFLSRERPSDGELAFHAGTPLAPGPFPFLDLSIGRRVAVVGAPVVLSSLFFVAVYLLLARVVTSAGGDAAFAALGVGLRGEQFTYVVGVGFASAAGALVARRLGAGSPEGAARAAWSATRIASVASLAWSLGLLLVGGALARTFLPKDPVAAAEAADYLRIVALCLVPQCWEVVLDGAFGGAGMTVPPMVVSMALTAARIPLARWAAFDLRLGVAGIWWVIAATAALRGVLAALWFARGTWKTRPAA